MSAFKDYFLNWIGPPKEAVQQILDKSIPTGSAYFYPEEKTKDRDLIIKYSDIREIWRDWALGRYETEASQYSGLGQTKRLVFKSRGVQYDIIIPMTDETFGQWEFATRYFKIHSAHKIPYKDKVKRVAEFKRLKAIAQKLYCKKV